jgi:hypothetical protein
MTYSIKIVTRIVNLEGEFDSLKDSDKLAITKANNLAKLIGNSFVESVVNSEGKNVYSILS